MKKIIVSALALVAGLVASADPVGPLSVDFRDSAWSGANGVHSYSVGDVTASGYALKVNLFAPDSVVNANLKQNSVDGLGVDSRILGEDPGEVGPREILDVDFSGASGNNLTGAWVTQLFDELVDDIGHVALWGANGLIATIDFPDNFDYDSSGNYWVDFGGAHNLTSAVFYADSAVLAVGLNRDYSVAGFTAQAPNQNHVPDNGTTALLLGAGLLGLGLVRRFKRA
jgi:hypothetical protein